jgi:hypothetical protein
MNEQNKNTEEKKTTGQSGKTEKEKTWQEKIAEQVGGDNEMMKSLIKFITHPLVLVGGMLAFFYWLFKDKGQKEEIDKLKKENEAMKESLKGIEKKFDEMKISYEKLRDELKPKEENLSGFGNAHSKNSSYKTKRYHSAYLD